MLRTITARRLLAGLLSALTRSRCDQLARRFMSSLSAGLGGPRTTVHRAGTSTARAFRLLALALVRPLIDRLQREPLAGSLALDRPGRSAELEPDHASRRVFA